MTTITEEALQKLTSDQLVVGLGLVTPEGKPHCTPVWINQKGMHLYIFTKSERAKVRYVKANSECMIAFTNGAVRGTIELINKGTSQYDQIKDLPDARYSYDKNLQMYKDNWDVAMKISPTKII